MPEQSKPDTSRTPTNIVVQMGSGASGLAAMRTAMQLAQAFSFPVEGLFVEDEQLLAAAKYSFTHEITSCSGCNRPVAPRRLAREMQVQAIALRRQMHHLAKVFEIVLHTHIVRDNVEHALCKASVQARFVALSQSRAINAGTTLFSLIERLPHIEGFLLVGAKAKARSGPVVLALENSDSASHQLKFAAQLATSMGGELILLCEQADVELWRKLETMIMPLQAQGLRVRMLEISRDHLPDIPHIIRRVGAHLLLAQIGGRLSVSAHRLGRLTASLGTPLLLFR